MKKRPTWNRVRISLDQMMPDRPVHRMVRGIDMLLPRRHILPYLATAASPYAVNLVELAVELGRREGTEELVVLDVGANVGDSTLLIRDKVRTRTVCVEGDPQWLTYLGANVGARADCVIEPVLLSGAGEEQYVEIFHADMGSSRVERADAATGTATVPADRLLARRPELERVRLVKSDTDGYDVRLIPDLARSFSGSRPVVFFEYDPVPTRMATPELEPSSVFSALADLGYGDAVVWTNGGHLLGGGTLAELVDRSKEFDTLSRGERMYDFWDVAVAHRDDEAGTAALRTMLEAGAFPVARPW